MENKEQARAFGTLLATLRKAKGISGNRLALCADINQSHLSQVERGNRLVTSAVIQKLADALNPDDQQRIFSTDEIADLKRAMLSDLAIKKGLTGPAVEDEAGPGGYTLTDLMEMSGGIAAWSPKLRPLSDDGKRILRDAMATTLMEILENEQKQAGGHD